MSSPPASGTETNEGRSADCAMRWLSPLGRGQYVAMGRFCSLLGQGLSLVSWPLLVEQAAGQSAGPGGWCRQLVTVLWGGKSVMSQLLQDCYPDVLVEG